MAKASTLALHAPDIREKGAACRNGVTLPVPAYPMGGTTCPCWSIALSPSGATKNRPQGVLIMLLAATVLTLALIACKDRFDVPTSPVSWYILVAPALACLNTYRAAITPPVLMFVRDSVPMPTRGVRSPNVAITPATAALRDRG